jgi:RND family efflux transporter MFP subunit
MKRSLYLVSAIISGWIALGCSHSAPVPAAPPTARAQLVHSAAADTAQTIQMTGTVHAKETAMISPQVPGRLRSVLVQAGDNVRAGQLLATLDDAAMQSALGQTTAAQTALEKQQAAAQANAQLAAATLARYEILKAQKSVSPQEFDEVEKRCQGATLQLQALEAQSQGAQAAVEGARTQLGYTTLHAPFAGVITARLADPGTLAAPGVPLLQLDREGPLQVFTTVDESLIGAVHIGMKVPVSAGGIHDADLSGTVAEIVPAADPASHSFLVKLDLPPTKNLRAGMYAAASFPGTTKPMILAPQSAVVMRGSLACVYALDSDGIAQLRYVTLGNRHGDEVEILSGLAAGESLVDKPGDRDLAGRRIEPANGAQP